MAIQTHKQRKEDFLSPLEKAEEIVSAETRNGTSEGVRWQQVVNTVAERLWAGLTPLQVVRELEHGGLDYGRALALVEEVEEQLRRGGAL